MSNNNNASGQSDDVIDDVALANEHYDIAHSALRDIEESTITDAQWMEAMLIFGVDLDTFGEPLRDD